MKNYLNNIITKVDGNEFKILHVIYHDVNSSLGECVLTNSELEFMTGMSLRKVNYCLKSLEEKGILSRDTERATLFTVGIRHDSNPRTIKLKGVTKEKQDTTVFDNFWKTVIKKTDTKVSKKRFMALSMEDQEQVMETYAYYQETRMNQYNDKKMIKALSSFINLEWYKDEDWNVKRKRNFGQNVEYYSDILNELYYKINGTNDGERIRDWVTEAVRQDNIKKIEKQIKIWKEKLAQSK